MPLTRKNLNLSAQQVAWFDELAQKTGISASELIRRALDAWRRGEDMQQQQEWEGFMEPPEATYYRLALFARLEIEQMLASGALRPLMPGDHLETCSTDGYKIAVDVIANAGSTQGGPVISQLVMAIFKPDGEKLVIDRAAMAQLQATVIEQHRESMGRDN
jgi:Arc/MetJ-type ribon-helix-helix transcriptional regulator